MKLYPRRNASEKPIMGRFLCTLVGGLLALSTAYAAETTTPINLQAAISNTLSTHPELAVFASRAQVIAGEIRQAGIADRATINLTVEDAFGTGEQELIKSMQTTFTYTWVVQDEILDARVAAATSGQAILKIEQQIAALDLAADTAAKYIGVLIAQERLKLQKLSVIQSEEVLANVTAKVTAGIAPVTEQFLAKAELQRRLLAVEDALHEIKARKYALTSLWGLQHQEFTFSGDLLDIPARPDVEMTLARIKDTPQLQKFATEERVLASKIALADTEATPRWQFSAGVRRLESTDDFGLVAGVSIPWGEKASNAGTIMALKAQQDGLLSQYKAAEQALDAKLYVLLLELEHSYHVIETIKTGIIPELENALTEANRAFENGQLNYSVWSDIRNQHISAQLQLLDAYEMLHLQHIEIQRLTGTSLSS
ncbi:outer membrane protein, cobalt-zinc-cadmium efflux system [Marisediminitalea aggregata]|uniref:Outer membrane protein, cobalt-zinc-cadmium efflux system n=1 Tax=Marisediminitalea aggregata TaxID=634436 RepID=A0A1M5F245_9ALTE|nr:TolC family protein [Marisediminitalea aggregata]SHF85527.1 outer membrane protein, cobalt-zinc-cadmium efflux system [Marisediminitalea aggregata]